MDDWHDEKTKHSCFDEKTLREMLDCVTPSYQSSESHGAQSARRDSTSSESEEQGTKVSALPSPTQPTHLPPISKHKKVSHKLAHLQQRNLFFGLPHEKETDMFPLPLPPLPPLAPIAKSQRDALKEEEPLGLLQLSWDIGGDLEDTSKILENLDTESLSSCPAQQKRQAVLEIKARVSAIEDSISMAKKVLGRIMQPKP